jgi:hypothetical protein
MPRVWKETLWEPALRAIAVTNRLSRIARSAGSYSVLFRRIDTLLPTNLPQRPVEVADQILDILNAHRQPDQLVAYT